MELKVGISELYIPLKCAVQTGESLRHRRVAISIALYLFRPFEVPQGEGQCQTFILFPKNESKTENWICFFHLSKKERGENEHILSIH